MRGTDGIICFLVLRYTKKRVMVDFFLSTEKCDATDLFFVS